MKIRILAATLLLAFAPIAAGTPAFAQPADDPTVKAARARFNEGVEFFDKGQYENARAAFLQAYALRKHPAVLLNLAQSSLRAGHALEASKYFQQYLKESTSLTAAQRSDAEKGLADARTRVGRIEISAPTGAEITVDGDHVGTAPLTDLVDVEPGSHTVKAGGETKTINVAGGQQASAKFGPGGGSGAVVAPPPGSGNSAATPGDTPTDSSAQPPGDQTSSTTPATAEVKTTNLFSRPQTMAPVWVGVGVGVVGFATAVIFAVAKSSANNSYNSIQNQIKGTAGHPSTCVGISPTSRFAQACSTLSDDANQVNTDATVANVGVAVGVVGLAFGLGWYLFAPKRDSANTTTGSAGRPGLDAPPIVPVIGPHMSGLSFSQAF